MDTKKQLSSVSFFCPAYREEVGLRKLIPRIHVFLSEITQTFEILIVEDGSPDKTGEIADELAKEFSNVRVIHHAQNQGYGVSMRDGFQEAQYDYIMYTDSDNQYDVQEFSRAIPLLSEADIVSGYVQEKAASTSRKIQSGVFNIILRAFFFLPYSDINCAMKIYKRKALDAQSLRSGSVFIVAESIIRAQRNGYKIAQFPVNHFERTEGMTTSLRLKVVLPTIRDILKFKIGLL